MLPKKLNRYLTLPIAMMVLSMIVMTGCSDDSSSPDTGDTAPVTETAEPVEIDVSAAASMTDALQEVNEFYMTKHENVTVVANFASSGTLQKQIEQGAPADVFISAASKQMNALQDAGLIVEASRKDLLNNKVVLIVPFNSTLDITSFTDLVNDDVKQIAIGDPEFVPAGQYGQQALKDLSIYEQVQDKLILGSDVRQVLGYVESGNVDAGIVYSTDAAITEGVKIVADGPASVNDKIVYPVAIIKSSTKASAAQDYIDFLSGSEAAAILEKYGFSVIGN